MNMDRFSEFKDTHLDQRDEDLERRREIEETKADIARDREIERTLESPEHD